MPTERIHFSKRTIERIKPPASGRTWYRDAGSGLWLAVFHTGRRVFYSYRKLRGRPERIKLGQFGDIGVEQARRELAKLDGAIAAGRNVADERRAARRLPLFGELVERYLTQPRRNGRDNVERRPETVRAYRSAANNGLAEWTNKPLANINRAAVEELVSRIGSQRGRSAANSAIKLMRAVLEYAVELELLAVNPARKTKVFGSQARERHLSADELARLWRALDASPEPVQDLVRLALFTAARRENLLTMKRDEFDLPGAVWTISATKAKAGKAIRIPLAAEAVAILERRLAASDSDYVFPGQRGQGAMSFPLRDWQSLLTRANITAFVFHDLRRTAATLAAAAGAPLPAVSKLLGHSKLATTGVYARPDDDSTRRTVDELARRITATVEPAK